MSKSYGNEKSPADHSSLQRKTFAARYPATNARAFEGAVKGVWNF